MRIAATNIGVSILEFLFFGGAILAAIITPFRQQRSRRKRSGELRMLARRMGFESFQPERDDNFARGWGFLSQLARGDNRYAFNVLRGSFHDETLFVFDYHYQSGSGKSTENHDCTMLMLIFKEVFPQLGIGPERLLKKIATALRLEADIQFESAEFSRKFCVQSPDKKFAYDVCNPQMIDYLLANPDLHIEIQGPTLMLTFEPLLSAGQIEYNLQRLAEIRSRLPQYLFTNV